MALVPVTITMLHPNSLMSRTSVKQHGDESQDPFLAVQHEDMQPETSKDGKVCRVKSWTPSLSETENPGLN